MDEIFVRTKALIVPEVSLLVQSPATQSASGGSTVVLWSSAPLNISSSIREDFETAMKRRGAKHYPTSSTLSYPKFCIALLCCSRYGLNHTITPLVPARAYTAAWRGIEIVAATAKEEVRSWLSIHINHRSAEGYCSALGINTITTDVGATGEPSTNTSTKTRQDEAILSSVGADDKAVCIDSSRGETSGIDSDSFTPEGQLMSLSAYYENKLRQVGQP